MKIRFRDRTQNGDFSLHFARNGVEALEQLAATPDFDLMITDLNMPEMDGLTLLAEVQRTYPNLQTIVISAYRDLSSIRTAMNRGAFDFITKPMDFDDVEITIDKTLHFAVQVRESRLAQKYRRDKEVAETNLQRLREMETLREDLTQMLVHDLRTPLTSLLGGMQSVQFVGTLSPIQKECVQMAAQGGESLLRMINDLLDIWKMEDHALSLKPQDVDAAELTRLAAGCVQSIVQAKSQNLEFEVSPALPPLHADADLLERVMVNLLANALKFSPVRSTVRVTLRPLHEMAKRDDLTPCARRAIEGATAESVWVSVHDEGEGIPESAFERIFEKFGQANSRQGGRKMSSGLGLTFCKMAVEAHGGTIWVESTLGQGSTFSFLLPQQPHVSGTDLAAPPQAAPEPVRH